MTVSPPYTVASFLAARGLARQLARAAAGTGSRGCFPVSRAQQEATRSATDKLPQSEGTRICQLATTLRSSPDMKRFKEMRDKANVSAELNESLASEDKHASVEQPLFNGEGEKTGVDTFL